MKRFRLVRHEAGAMNVLAEIEMDPLEASEVNRALVKTLVRLWPVPREPK